MKKILVTGSSGFIGNHLVRKLKNQGYFVVGVDIVQPQYEQPHVFYNYDLRHQGLTHLIFQEQEIDTVYNLACLMGGMGFIGDEKQSYDIMIGSSQIISNIIQASVQHRVPNHFYSSSACVYNMYIQEELTASLKEADAYPAMPDLVYGWQKLFSEQMYQAAAKSYDFLNIRIARFHNIFGTEGTYDGGKEKAPAALSRKVAKAKDGDEIEVWGSGKQVRSFLYIDECLEGIERLMRSDCKEPINIGSDESISINDLAQMVIDISGKKLKIKNVEGVVGVQGRNSDNTMIFEKLGWKPTQRLFVGMEKTYKWINEQVNG